MPETLAVRFDTLQNEIWQQAAIEADKRLTEKSHLLSTKRNQAMIEFFVSTGVRSIELRNLCIHNLSPDLSECYISTAKGGNNRVVFLGIPAQDALFTYLQARKINQQKDKNLYLFPGKGNQPMKASAVSQVIKRLSQRRIGFGISPHMIRHSFATEMLRATGYLRSVQEMMGRDILITLLLGSILNLTDSALQYKLGKT